MNPNKNFSEKSMHKLNFTALTQCKLLEKLI